MSSGTSSTSTGRPPTAMHVTAAAATSPQRRDSTGRMSPAAEVRVPMSEVRRVQVSLASRARPGRPPPPPPSPHISCKTTPPTTRSAGDVTITSTSAAKATRETPPLPSNVAVNNNVNGVRAAGEEAVKREENDRAAKALEESFRQLERAISSLEQDIERTSTPPPLPPRPSPKQKEPFFLHDPVSSAPSSPAPILAPSRAKIVDARRQFFSSSASPTHSSTAPPPAPPPADLSAVFDSFRQRAQEGRERVARSVVDLSEIERACRVQIDSLLPSPPAEPPSPPPTTSAPPSSLLCSSSESSSSAQQTRARAAQSSPRAARPRSHSASGYLETDVDTLQSREVLHKEHDVIDKRTELNFLLFESSSSSSSSSRREGGERSHHHPVKSTSSPTKAASMLSLPGEAAHHHHHHPRAKPTSPSHRICPDEADRARGMEFLLDADNKAAARPPENQLMRGGGGGEGGGVGGTERLSQNEMRIRRSLQRLDVPEWFKNSPHSRSGSFLLLKQRSPSDGGWRGASASSSRTPSASSLVSTPITAAATAAAAATPTNTSRPRAATTASATPAAAVTRVSQPYCWRYYPRWSRESLLASPGSPSPSPQERGAGFQFSRWSSTRLSSGGASSTPSPSPTGSTSFARPHHPHQRQPYLGWRSSERLTREVCSAHSTPTHTLAFYRSAAERLSAGPGYYAMRYGAYGHHIKPGSEGNLLATTPTTPSSSTSVSPQPPKHSPAVSPASSKPPIGPKPVVSPTSGQYRSATTTPVANGYAHYRDAAATTPPPPHLVTTSDDAEGTSPRDSPRQRVIWVESSFVGVKPNAKAAGAAASVSPGGDGEGGGGERGDNRSPSSPPQSPKGSPDNRPTSRHGSDGSDDIRLNKAKRSFGQIHDEEGPARDSSSSVATLEEVLDSLLAIPSSSSRSVSPCTRSTRFYVAGDDSDSDNARGSSRRSSANYEPPKMADGAGGFTPPFGGSSEPSSRSGSFSAGRLSRGGDPESPQHHYHHHHHHHSPLPTESNTEPHLHDEPCMAMPSEGSTLRGGQPNSSTHNADDDEDESDDAELGLLGEDELLDDNDVILSDRRGSHPRPPTPPPRPPGSSVTSDATGNACAAPDLHHVRWGSLPESNTTTTDDTSVAAEGEGGGGAVETTSTRRRGTERLRNLLPDDLLVRCGFPRCAKTVAWVEARRSFKTCHNCYTYYCSRECRRLHWDKHRRTCMYSRVRSMCRHVILRSHDDVAVRAHLSKLARTGALTQGRGFIKLVFRNPELVERFMRHGWSALEDNPIYVAWRDLLPMELGPEITNEVSEMCKQYNPEIKFILLAAVYITREIPAQPVPRWEREVIAKCAKVPLRKPGGPSGDMYGDPSLEPDTLILTAVPPVTDMSPDKARQVCFTNIQRHLCQRGVSLKHQFPDVFDKLNSYVDSSEAFTPITIYPKDGRTGKTFMCLIMPNTEPEIEAMVKDFARK